MPAAADDSGRTPVPGMLRPDTTSKSFLAGAGYVRYHADGRVADTVIIPPQPEVKSWRVREKDNRMSMSVPLMPGLQRTFDRAGHFVWGQQARYEIVISRKGLDTLRIFSSVAGTFPIPDSIRREEFDQAIKNNPMLKSVARFDDIPRNYPAWTSMCLRWEWQLLGDPTRPQERWRHLRCLLPRWRPARRGPRAIPQRLSDLLDPRSGLPYRG